MCGGCVSASAVTAVPCSPDLISVIEQDLHALAKKETAPIRD